MVLPAEGSKVFVIDTNVLIHNPEALNSFRDTEIVVPLTVLEELDKLKTYPDQRGRSARQAIRALDSATKGGNVQTGAKLENGSVLRIPFEAPAADCAALSLDQNDNKILLQACALQAAGRRVFFVSKDINARVKASALGIKAVDYEKQKVDAARLYQGYREVETDREFLDDFIAEGEVSWKERLHANEFVQLNERGGEKTALGRYHHAVDKLFLVDDKPATFGVRPLNPRQNAALDLLLDDDVPCVTLVGRAGTGKTLLALAAALRKTVDEQRYSRILVSRPIIPLGKDIGFLPGEKLAKLSNWMQPIFDNLEFLFANNKKPAARAVDQLIKNRTLEVEAVTFIRGRSLPNQFILIDEAQNLTPHEIKTIVSRAGEKSKVVLTGDPQQIDNMYLDADSNGLAYLVEAFKGRSLFGHISLKKTERSALAELAAELL